MITFLICRLAPGDPTEMKLGQTGEAQKTDAKNQMTEQAKEFYKKKFGLDKSLPMQYVIWMGNMLQGDFGNSFKDNRPVLDKIVERLPVSITISLLSFLADILNCYPNWYLQRCQDNILSRTGQQL